MQVQQDPSVGPSMDLKRNCSLTAPFHDLRGIPCCLFVDFLVASLRHFLVATRQGMLCTLDGATGSLLQLSCKEYWLWNIWGHWNATHWTYPPRTLTCPLKRDRFKHQKQNSLPTIIFRGANCEFLGEYLVGFEVFWVHQRFFHGFAVGFTSFYSWLVRIIGQVHLPGWTAHHQYYAARGPRKCWIILVALKWFYK